MLLCNKDATFQTTALRSDSRHHYLKFGYFRDAVETARHPRRKIGFGFLAGKREKCFLLRVFRGGRCELAHPDVDVPNLLALKSLRLAHSFVFAGDVDPQQIDALFATYRKTQSPGILWA